MLGLSGIPALDVLQGRGFRILWAARSLHELSRRMELLVLGYLILRLTSSPFQVGLIAVFLNAPGPLIGLFAGLIADRLDRRRIMAGVHAIYCGFAAILLILLITDAIQPWWVFIAIVFQGSAKLVYEPARRTAIFDLAGQDRIVNAMSLDTITNNIGRIVGPLAGGILIAVTGFIGAYAAIVALDLTCLLMMAWLRLPLRSTGSEGPMLVWQSLREGIRHALSNRMVLGVLSMSLIVNALVFPIQYFIPVIASDLLHVGPKLGGVLGSAEGIGTLLGALIIAMTRNIRYHGRLFAGGALIVAILVMSVAWSPWFAVSFTLLLLGGLGQAGFSTMQGTILLLASAPEMRGRTLGASGVVNSFGHLVGGPEIGAIASAFGMTLAIGLNAGLGILLVLVVILLTPLVWRPVRPPSEDPTRREKTPTATLSAEPGRDD